MRHLQPITHRGRIVALVISDHAIIDDTLAPDEHRHVKAMCLYALQLADHDPPGRYTDTAAHAYALKACSPR
ncbi:MAG: hypothetical protein ACYCXW_22760 [Solirubrobacteraceae bacterium]